ncbi:MAG: thiamine phosphate synthase [Sphingomonadaceae bacterium]
MALSKQEMLRLLVNSGVYLVTEDAVAAEGRLRSVDEALSAGARIVQLRDKRTPKRRLLEEARSMKALCEARGAAFIVNDDVALAWAADADGVHLGQDDLPVEEARRLLGPEKLIGLSISALEEALEADRQGVDYIGVGAIFATPTKTDAELGGLQLLERVRWRVKRPLVAIGGIDALNAGTVFRAGADAVAVVRAVFARPSIADATRELLEIARRARVERESN